MARLQEEPALVDDEDGGGWEEDDWGDMDVSGRSSSQLTALYLLPCCLQTLFFVFLPILHKLMHFPMINYSFKFAFVPSRGN